jgi:hypothetical protein
MIMNTKIFFNSITMVLTQASLEWPVLSLFDFWTVGDKGEGCEKGLAT